MIQSENRLSSSISIDEFGLLMEQESSESVDNRLDCIERHMSQKIEILKEVEELKIDEEWIENTKTH